MFLNAKIERVKSRIEASVIVDDDGCWIWTKTKSNNGYGTFAFGGGKNARAHRVAYEVFNGPIPDGMDICHRCDVRACVNPTHLFAGTRSENLLDASRKNRISRSHQKKGEEHGQSKLKNQDVIAILDLLKAGKSKTAIAVGYGVSNTLIGLIARNQAWKHIVRVSP